MAFILSLLSKGQALIFPIIIALIDWYYYKTENKKIDFKTIAYFIPVSLFFAWLAFRAQLYTGYLSQTEDVSLSQIIFYPGTILSNYVFKLFVPINLSAQYTIPKISDLVGQIYLLIIPLALVILLIFAYIKNKHIYFLGLCFI